MKGLKRVLAILVLIPCLLIVACSGSAGVTKSEYNALVTDAAKGYYKNYSGKTMTITIEKESEKRWQSEVYFGWEGNSEPVEFYEKTKIKQTIEIFFKDGYDYPSIKTFMRTDKTESGKNGGSEVTSPQPYKKTSYNEGSIYYIYSKVDGESKWRSYWTWKAFDSESDDNEVDSHKEISRINTDIDRIDNGIASIIDTIETSIFAETFFSNEYLLLEVLTGAAPELYNKGKGSFGWGYNSNLSTITGSSIVENNIVYDVNFKNNVPNEVTMKQTVNTISSKIEKYEANLTGEGKIKVTVEYDCDEITEPSGFENADEMDYSYKGLSIVSFDFDF